MHYYVYYCSGSTPPSILFCLNRRREARLHTVSVKAETNDDLSQRISAAESDSDDIASMIAVMQALISVFLDEHDKLRSINAGKTRITFLTRPPLYYVCVSSWGEPESVVRIITLSFEVRS